MQEFILSINEKQHISFANYIIQNNLSVRESEKISKKWPFEIYTKKSHPKIREIEIQKAEEKISQKFQTKVNIVGSSIKGKIHIEYFKQEDLERILETLNISM